jgi:ketosteroid isomerase-like protein
MKTSGPCPSDFTLERLLLEELPESAGVASHVDACATCRSKIAAKRQHNDEFFRSAGARKVRDALSGAEVTRRPGVLANARPAGEHLFAERGRSSTTRRGAVAALAIVAIIALGIGIRRFVLPPPIAAIVNEEQVVLGVQREWMEAIRDKDAPALDRILADDYTYTDARGNVSTKADSLRQARTTRDRMKAFYTTDERARVYGDLAVITGHLRVEGEFGGAPYDDEVRFTDILARIDGKWRAVAAHASKPSEHHAAPP